ncbi:hypothetical protein [Allochromatium palmeri]|uniref:Sulfotransferase family protein n=1 Tax=Allochromatium palmeri TaxID=231048 RepID=A0A6N8EFD0_9GAMM|nr:hypothetical protein [Allochromatium palmeri]MTW21247.1 hypothetical protein [Allochromatium palmeri]
MMNKDPIVRRILVTGCGRSGTHYVTSVLRRLGMDVLHEKMGADGIVAWQFAIKEVLAKQANGRGVAFEHVVHLVRDPIKVISSNHTNNEHAWSHIFAYCPECKNENLTVQCAKFWTAWNKRAEEVADFRIRLEDFSNQFALLCSILKLSENRDALVARNVKDIDSRSDWKKYKNTSWDELYSLDRVAAQDAWELARSYGYYE